MDPVTPNIEHYARFVLEKVLQRQRYTGLTLLEMSEALEQIFAHHKNPGKPSNSDLAVFIKRRKERNQFPREGDTRV